MAIDHVHIAGAHNLGQLPGVRRRWGWGIGAGLATGVVAVPLAAVVWLAANPTDNIWPHLLATVLPGYIWTTLRLMLGVAIGTVVIGVGTAWLVTMCQFPFRRLFGWALMLPLAVPAYIVAYVYTDLLDYAGPVQAWLRQIFGWQSPRDYGFPGIRSLGGAVTVMSLTLYPYVYMLARASFIEQSMCVLEASRMLGRRPWHGFVSVAVPLARPAIVVGVALALMETLNDFGTVDFFAVQTLTAGVFTVWLQMNNVGGAAQIALVMLGAVIALLAAERLARRGRRFHHTTTHYRNIARYRLSPARRALAVIACAAPILLGYGLPTGLLARYALQSLGSETTDRYFDAALNSISLSTAAAIMAVCIGAFLAYSLRLGRGRWLVSCVRVASVGYAIPGAVLAIGVIVPFAATDNFIDDLARRYLGVSTGLILSGTAFAVVFAYVARFLAVSFGALEASLTKVPPSLDMAARALGHGPGSTLLRVHLPLMRASLVAASALVFVDCMKELPATLILRPFNFETLATHVYQYASDELLREASLSALSIVVVGLVPVILLSRAITRPVQATQRAASVARPAGSAARG